MIEMRIYIQYNEILKNFRVVQNAGSFYMDSPYLVLCREYLSSTLRISFFQHDNDLFHGKIVSRSTRSCILPFIRHVVSGTCGKAQM